MAFSMAGSTHHEKLGDEGSSLRPGHSRLERLWIYSILLSMLLHVRQESILGLLSKRPIWNIEALCRKLGVSRSTLRRDLLELEHLGHVVRVRGGVMHRDHARGEPNFELRRARRVEQKRAIAEAAEGLIEPHFAVYLDAGTTCFEIGQRLIRQPGLRLFTHSIRLVAKAIDAEASLTCIGGEFRPISEALTGGLALSWLENLRFDVAFIAASGIDANGVATTELSEASIKQQLLRRADRRILVADSDKWGKPAAIHFADLTEFDTWIVDNQLPRAARRAAEKAGIELVVTRPKRKGSRSK